MDLLFIPALPLFSFAILIFFGRRLGKFSAAVSLLALAGSFFFSVRSFQLVAHHVSPRVYWNWFPFGGGTFEMGLLADPLSATMCLVVTGIGWL
ncbi:MAG: NADH-quinone oxidoreductase subunit L, partial [Candidatus Omnitrophica bacterium]|nr:NADH-quinone oxidoreductase subunit L [Candidatus Omnitrophota bacterium]